MKSKDLLHKSAAEHNLTHILKRASSPPRQKRGGGVRSLRVGGGRFQKPIDKPKTRKELRKEMRKSKKSKKHTYILSKFGKTPESDLPVKAKRKRKNRKRNRNLDKKKDEYNDVLKEDEVGDASPGKYVKIRAPEQGTKKKVDKKLETSSRAAADRLEDDKELVQLKKDMEETRKRRLLDENAEEDKFISQMEKRLRLNKKAKIPESFRTDGLDCKAIIS